MQNVSLGFHLAAIDVEVKFLCVGFFESQILFEAPKEGSQRVNFFKLRSSESGGHPFWAFDFYLTTLAGFISVVLHKCQKVNKSLLVELPRMNFNEASSGMDFLVRH